MDARAVQAVVEGLELPALSKGAAQALAPEVEYRVRELAQEALKVARHAKRQRLTPGDIDAALRLRGVEQTYGFGAAGDPQRYVKAAGLPDVVFAVDPILRTENLVDKPLPLCPVEAGLRLHWLAVKGQVPVLEENAPVPKDKLKPAQEGGRGETVVAPIKHVVPEELHLYFERVSEILLGEDEGMKRKAISSLAHEPGLHPLTPYFTQLLTERIKHKDTLSDLNTLQGLVDIVWGLASNPHVDIEIYLHKFLPVVLTCLVGGTLGQAGDNHWQLRQRAAATLKLICRNLKDSEAFYQIQSRLVKTLLTQGFLDTKKPLTSHYGAVVGLGMFGSRVVRTLLLPNLDKYMAFLDAILHSETASLNQKHEANQVLGVLIRATGCMIHELLTAEETAAARGKRTRAAFEGKVKGGPPPAAANGTGAEAGEEAGVRVEDGALETDCQQLYKLFGEAILPFVPTAYARLNIAPC